MAKIVFFGTSEQAAVILKNLFNAGHQIPLVVTQPDKPQGRKLHHQPTPVKQQALSLGLPVAIPEKLKDAAWVAQLQKIAADFFVVVAYGRILPACVFSLPPGGCLNLHFSLLPRWRGAAPVQYAILNGDQETGVTVMQISAGLDEGAILHQGKLSLSPPRCSREVLVDLTQLGYKLLAEVLSHPADFPAVQQNEALVTYSSPIYKAQGNICWQGNAKDIFLRSLAFDPQPGVFSFFRGDRLLIKKIRWSDLPAHIALQPPGTLAKVQLFQSAKWELVVHCGTGLVILDRVQIAGKKEMQAIDFFHGYRIAPMERLLNHS